jgi:hypothetical protein
MAGTAPGNDHEVPGNLMIITTPCMRPYQYHPGVSHQSRQLRAPSGDYAKAVHCGCSISAAGTRSRSDVGSFAESAASASQRASS